MSLSFKILSFCKLKSFTLSDAENECLGTLFDSSKIQTIQKFTRIIFNGYRFTSHFYLRTKKTNDSVFQTKNGTFGIITKICKISLENIARSQIISFR